jgi:hypothetical protein
VSTISGRVGDLGEINFSGEGYDMDDNEIQKIFEDGKSKIHFATDILLSLS